MKKFLQFSGLISLVIAVVAFILMLATDAVVVTSGDVKLVTGGAKVIFGHDESTILGNVHYNAAPLALIAWILALVALLILLAGFILPLLKVNALEKFAGVLNLVAVACLVVAGIFMFCVVPNYYAANDANVPNGAGIGAGWVIGGILAIAAGAIAICPAVVDFLGKRK